MSKKKVLIVVIALLETVALFLLAGYSIKQKQQINELIDINQQLFNWHDSVPVLESDTLVVQI